MKEFDFNLLIENKDILNNKIREFTEKGVLKKQNPDKEEIKGPKNLKDFLGN